MNSRAIRRYQTFGRARNFCIQYASDFDPRGKVLVTLGVLERIIEQLAAAAVGQTRPDNRKKALAFKVLKTMVRNIARTARAIAKTVPGFAARFRLPAKDTQAALLVTADSYLAELQDAEVAAELAAYELGADFVQRFADARADVKVAQQGDDQGGTRVVESTAAVTALVRLGMDQLATLNAIMHNRYVNDPAKLQAWRSACRVKRDPHYASDTAAEAEDVASNSAAASNILGSNNVPSTSVEPNSVDPNSVDPNSVGAQSVEPMSAASKSGELIAGESNTAAFNSEENSTPAPPHLPKPPAAEG